MAYIWYIENTCQINIPLFIQIYIYFVCIHYNTKILKTYEVKLQYMIDMCME